MRVAVLYFALPVAQAVACSCIGPGTPSTEAGRSAAVFTGTVFSITDPVFPPPGSPNPGRVVLTPFSRAVRLRVSEALSGVTPGQEVEVRTGTGGGNCGFPFETGKSYFIYASRASGGKLATGSCTRTAALDKAAEDLEYLRSKAGTAETGRLAVHTSYPGTQIAVEGPDGRHLAVTNAAGVAIFESLPPGTYRAHYVTDGDLKDDPKFELGARGTLDVTLLRILKIRGRVTTRDGQAPMETDIELRSVSGEPSEVAGIGGGRYEIRLSRPGRYYLGVNLNQGPTARSPYGRWFHPGTADQASATVIEFSDAPGSVNYDLTLPDPKRVRIFEGVAAKFAQISVSDSQGRVVTRAFADERGNYRVELLAEEAYRLTAGSALPIEIEATAARTN